MTFPQPCRCAARRRSSNADSSSVACVQPPRALARDRPTPVRHVTVSPVRRRIRENHRMHVTAKADYAVRAVVELAGSKQESPRKVDEVAKAQGIPVSFLENILTQLRSSGIVRSQRGPEGGYWLSKPPDQVNLAQIIRAVE